MIKTKNRHTKIKMLGILSVGFVAVCGIYLFNHSFVSSTTDSNLKNKVSLHDKYSGFQAGTKITRAILAKDTKISKDIQVTSNNASVISNTERFENEEQYSLAYQIINPNDSYVDITFVVNKQKIKTDISGLEKSDKVSFKLDKEYFMKETPLDWVGKTSFTAPVTNNDNQERFCLDILDNKQTVKSICHTILLGKETT